MRQVETPRAQDGALRAEVAEVVPGAPAQPGAARPSVEPAADPGGGIWPALGALVLTRRLPSPLAVVLGGYAIAAVVIPTFAPVSISDDWTYTRSVEILHQHGRLEVLPVAAASVVFQAIWAWLFTLVFGLSFGTIRLATIVLTGLSGLAFYGLCRELGIDTRRSALGTATYLFNPLAFVIGYSFMSDPYFVATLTITLYCFARGLQPARPRPWMTLAGSVAASCAFLVRVHGLGIPLGVTLYLLVTRRLRLDRASALLLARIWSIPLVVAAWYYLIFARGLPSQQGLFLEQAREAGADEVWLLIQRLTYFELVYAAFFALPILLAAMPAVRGLLRFGRWWVWSGVAAWGMILALGLRHFADKSIWLLGPERRTMPYIPHFFARLGLGARDIRGPFPAVAPGWVWQVFTALCIGGSLLIAIALLRRLSWGALRQGGVAGLLLACGVIQAGGPLPQSLLFRNWVISLDRYLLPLLPFTIALTLWALKDVRIKLPIAWVAVTLMALFAVAGTRDALVFQRNVWNMGRYALDLGIPMTRLDAGYAWDAYHLWEYSYDNGITEQTPPEFYTWWTNVYAPATDSAFIVASGPVNGYTEIAYVEYSSWLQTDPTYLYLMRRNDVPWPPG